jgi:selenocysteine lyase/cysteine desulfurase
MPDIHTVRGEFPGLAGKIYLDTATLGLPSRAAVVAAQRVVSRLERGPLISATAHQESLDHEMAAARTEGARLLSADLSEVAVIGSTTQALASVLAAIPMSEGDNIVVADIEFPQLLLVAQDHVARRRVELRTVPHQDGRLPVAVYAGAVDHRTRAVLVSSVQWTNGFRMDLGALSGATRRRGAFLIVDAVQQLGAVRMDTSLHRPDVIVCGGHTWLGAPFGAGLLFVSRDAQGQLEPPGAGYRTADLPRGGWEELLAPADGAAFRLARDARRFEGGGTANYVGAASLAASCALLNSVGLEAIESHVLELSGRLIEELRERHYRVVTPREAERRAGIVTVRLREDPRHESQIARKLLREKIHVAVRRAAGVGGVRFSVHAHTNDDDLFTLIRSLERLAPAAP